VDDDPGLLDALPEMIALRLSDVLVDACDSATEAIERLATTDYDAVISDIKMPIMDGLALLAECRRLQPDAPVLLITGHGEHDLSVQALRGGAFDFISKPIDRDYFSAALNRALDVRALRRTVANQRVALEAHARELEDRVARRTDELVRANRAKDDFLGMISHEMRTPLTVIAGGLSVLRSRERTLSPTDSAALMEDVHRESGRLSRMVEDLLVLARAEALTVVDPEPISLTPAATKLAEAMRARTGRPIAVKTAPELPLAAGDLTFVERVLENLLSNAVKYSGPEAPIELALNAPCAGFVTLTVSDAGPGVPTAELALIFNNFYRSASAEKVAGGHGIGLAVCKRLVEAMSGRIFARAAECGGLEVVVELPVYEVDEPGHERLVAAGSEPPVDVGTLVH
jgi:signal transduction histidine kinase